jgi:hypothetical protein
LDFKKYIFLSVLVFSIFHTSETFSQVENVPLNNDVYTFLHEMKVKGLIESIEYDDPNLSRAKVKSLLEQIESQKKDLSSTEKSLLKKYKVEFVDDQFAPRKSFQFFKGIDGVLSDKMKYLYLYNDKNFNFYFEGIGHIRYGSEFKPRVNNAELYDIGFRAHGTVLDKFGYNLKVVKGAASGTKELLTTLDPRLNMNFKFVEDLESYSNYDFTDGYIKYQTHPVEDMNVSVQLGREQLKFGYGYGSRLVLSGENPDMDFLKLNFKYGILDYTVIHASTVGPFNVDRNKNYTKYFVAKKIKLSFKDLFDFGMGESVVYADRGIDLGYLNPIAFYKFVEMSLQDRDNGIFFLDFQTKFLKGLEFQGTFFLDENILFNLNELSKYINKTAYQIGAFWYEPFSVPDLSLVLEYTRIRPYVYSHNFEKSAYTSWNRTLGHTIGPNADQIYTKLTYNFSGRLRGEFEFQKIRHGENVYDANGVLIKNVGGDALVPYRYNIDSEEAPFLDGIRINTDIFSFNLRYEPVREIYFDLFYRYQSDHNITAGTYSDLSYAYIKLTLGY